ncbi:MAG: molybdopterin-dependent oxidoreductase [Planctomycetota bacterium]
MTRTLRTTCARDCPDACGILAEVDGDRVLRLRGDPAHPVTRGFLCGRTSRFPARQHAGDRILGPRLRRGDGFVPIGWDEALDLCAARLGRVLDEDGPAGVCHLRSGGSLGLLKGLTDRWFRSLGPVTEVVGDICSGAGEAAQELDFGVSESHDLGDLRHARRLWLWGRNLGVSWLHSIPVVREALDRGLEVRNFDPIPPAPGLPAQRWTALRPAGDAALALAIGRALLDGAPAGFAERLPVPVEGLDGYAALCRSRSVAAWAEAAGVGASLPVELAAELRDGPVAQWLGWGLQRRRRGGLAVRVIDALAAVSGNLGVPGGGVSFNSRRRDVLDPAGRGEVRPEAQKLAVAGSDGSWPRRVDRRTAVGQQHEPGHDAAGVSVVATALRSTGFTVVVDNHPTDTTAGRPRAAVNGDSLEQDLCGSYGHHWSTWRSAQSSRGQGSPDRPAPRIIGRSWAAGSAARTCRADRSAGSPRILGPAFGACGPGRAGLARRGAAAAARAAEILFADGHAFPASERPGPPRRPRRLGRARSRRRPTAVAVLQQPPASSARSGTATRWRGPAAGRVHPAAARASRRRASHLVAARGGSRPRLELDERLSPTARSCPRAAPCGLARAANELVDAVETDLGGGAAYLDAWVEIEPA